MAAYFRAQRWGGGDLPRRGFIPPVPQYRNTAEASHQEFLESDFRQRSGRHDDFQTLDHLLYVPEVNAQEILAEAGRAVRRIPFCLNPNDLFRSP